MPSASIVGVGTTRFGRLEGRASLELMAEAAVAAASDAGVEGSDVDGLICGYATTLPHLMLADLFAEYVGIQPSCALSIQLGGATGAAMLMLARDLIVAGTCRTILVVAGENRLSGQSRDQTIQALSQVGDVRFEVPNGATVPSYYALLASRYLHETGLGEADLAKFAVLMRLNAATNPEAHLRRPIGLDEVMASRPISSPLKLLDCCPISDGAVAFIVSHGDNFPTAISIAGAGQAHRQQHVSALRDISNTGAGAAAELAFAQAGMERQEIGYLAIYDSFTITLAMLIEETGFAPFGASPEMVASGAFAANGDRPLNTHGGLLSCGHPGVSGGMAHVAEAVRQLRGSAGRRQIRECSTAFVHGDGGVMSAHVSLILERTR